MNVAELEAFWWVAQTGSMGRAARLLYLTQPSVTARVRVLETELGARLFARGSRGVELSGHPPVSGGPGPAPGQAPTPANLPRSGLIAAAGCNAWWPLVKAAWAGLAAVPRVVWPAPALPTPSSNCSPRPLRQPPLDKTAGGGTHTGQMRDISECIDR